jgi:carbon storage regulator
MLVLSRKLNESIVIGEKVRITVVKLTQNVVRLGIEAPADISVHRQEIQNEIDRQKNDGSESESNE